MRIHKFYTVLYKIEPFLNKWIPTHVQFLSTFATEDYSLISIREHGKYQSEINGDCHYIL